MREREENINEINLTLWVISLTIFITMVYVLKKDCSRSRGFADKVAGSWFVFNRYEFEREFVWSEIFERW